MRTAVAATTLTLAFVTALSSCSPSIRLSVAARPPDAIRFSSELGPAASALARRFGGDAPLFRVEETAISLQNAGLVPEKVETPTPTALRVSATLPALDGLLGAITVNRQNRTLTAQITRESLARALELAPDGSADFLELLMAPAITGEQISVAEYEQTIASAYGKSVADELRASTCTVTVDCPDPCARATISPVGEGKIQGTAAVFRVPLSALLVLDRPIEIRVAW
ncbi:MAG TPA: hypothetical protein PLU93_08985 [Treponemataceae bacterium]|nr:hypothetical protein [Treponemataceae bacterium]